MKEFKRLPLASVRVREGRQRKELHSVPDLAKSILDKGLIHPIAVDEENYLIAGERRLKAFQLLAKSDICNDCGFMKEGWFSECPECGSNEKVDHLRFTEIPATVHTVLNEWHREAIELAENLDREDLTPAERAMGVSRCHELLQSIHGPAKRGVGAGWGQRDTARELKQSVGRVNQHLQTARLLSIDPSSGDHAQTEAEIWGNFKAKRLKLIRAEIMKRQEAARDERSETIREQLDEMVFQGDAVQFLHMFPDESIDLIISDIPYGIDAFSGAGLRGSHITDVFDDSKDEALALINRVIPMMALKMKEHSHAFLFCSWQQTFQIMRAVSIMGKGLEFEFVMEQPPCIWDKLSAIPSRTPDSSFNKRHEYLCHIRKGKPSFGRALGDDILAERRVQEPTYPTEKPVKLLETLIDNSSEPDNLVVDFCCGSGSTVIAALRAGRRATACDSSAEAVTLTKYRILRELTPQTEVANDTDSIEGISDLFDIPDLPESFGEA